MLRAGGIKEHAGVIIFCMAFVILNGRVLDDSEATLPVLDWGILYGFGLFETMRAYGGWVFRLEDHLRRLSDSAKEIGLPLKEGGDALARYIRLALSVNSLSDAFVRLTVTYGIGGPRLEFNEDAKPNVFAVARALPENIVELQKKGVKLSVSGKYVRDPESPLTYIKSTNYLLNALAKREAKEAGVYDMLLLNKEGFVAETSTANIFTVADGKLLTPPTTRGLLPGITRKTVLELSKKEGIKAGEEDLTLEDVASADEVFITNSTLELIPVVSVDEKKVGSGKPGKMSRKLAGAYRKLVVEETRGRGLHPRT